MHLEGFVACVEGRLVVLCHFTSLTIHGELNQIVVAYRHMFTLVDWLTWVNMGGGCYRVASEHGSTLGLDGQNLFVMYARSMYMCLLCMHGGSHSYSSVSM